MDTTQASPSPVSKSDSLTILRRLAVKSGLSLGGLYHARPDEFRILLAAAARAVPSDVELREADVNTVLQNWLATGGAMLSTDHVELRRWLVDTGLLHRDGYGRAYRRADSPPARMAEALAALSDIDVGAQVAEARETDTAQRALRRARHTPALVAGPV